MSKYFCIYPFVSLETRNSGSVGLCCRSEPIGDIKTEGLLEMWNNDTIKQLRLDLLNGEKPDICKGCWQHEDIGIESKRTRNMNLDNPAGEYARFKDAEKQMLSDGTMPIPPQHVEFRLNNLCNLKCRMCNPLDSSSWDDWYLVKDIVAGTSNRLYNKIEAMGLTKPKMLDFYGEDFYRDVEKILPYLKRADFSGGEPLTNPAHYRVLDILMPRAHEIDLKYDTNFLTLKFKDRDLLDIWSRFKSLILNVSVDGIGDTYDYVRTNGDFNVLRDNLDRIRGFDKIKYMVFACATSIYNVHDMMNITRFAASYGAAHHMCKVSFPEFLSCQVLPRHTKNTLIQEFTEFLTEVDSLYTDKLFIDHTKNQYRDLITFLDVEQDPSLLDMFKKYDAALNTSRKSIIPIAVSKI